ncbi:MAG TPA: farnesyl diphosphate synthase [Symbiobacteriaceae bacterium]|nr:farnesyl diphosphate synthase [Symbiobacteriaceae bacterium]
MNVAEYLAAQSRAVDAALDRYTDPTNYTTASPDLNGVPAQLLEAMRYSLMAGGKRLRPVLVIAAAALFGAPAERVMPAACALEMIHTYSLIHDDLPCMDDDDLRRGRPTNHKVYGEAVATLAGDALLTMAFELASRQAEVPGVTAGQALRVVTEIATAAGAAGMVGGQIEDLAWEGKHAPAEQLKQIHRLKTGALFRASLRVGAILAGASHEDLARLDEYAAHFGLAFQIQDDVLDVVGDAVKTGKGVGRDQKHDKSTYVRHYGLEGAREAARAEVAAACAALSPYGENAAFLVGLAKFVIDREG